MWREVSAEIARIRPLDSATTHSLAYAVSEMVNNAIDHSAGRGVEVRAEFERGGTTVITVLDDGVGVFRRVCEDFGYATPADAIVQLEKGKLTSDPARHSGEGLFFSSQAVTRFRLESQRTAWIVDNVARDSGIGPSEVHRGTRVRLEVVPGHVPRLEDVFAAYTDADTLRFTRTRTTVRLATLGVIVVSRSEAKRLVGHEPRREGRRAAAARLERRRVTPRNPESHPPESNRRPTDYESVALPTELGWLLMSFQRLTALNRAPEDRPGST